MKRIALCTVLLSAVSLAQAAPWTYRGTLNDGGKPANGDYDLRITLLDETGARSVTQPITLHGVRVENGSFAADVDFGLDLSRAPAMKLKTEVAQHGSAFAGIGEPTRFDPKAALAGICWDTTGNVVAAGEFLGSTNNAVVELKSNNRRVARFDGAFGSANEAIVVLGSSANVATGRGATIGGGGSTSVNCGSGSSRCRRPVGTMLRPFRSTTPPVRRWGP